MCRTTPDPCTIEDFSSYSDGDTFGSYFQAPSGFEFEYEYWVFPNPHFQILEVGGVLGLYFECGSIVVTFNQPRNYVRITYSDESGSGYINFVAVDSAGDPVDSVTVSSQNFEVEDVFLGGQNMNDIAAVYMHTVEGVGEDQCGYECGQEPIIREVKACDFNGF